MASATSKIAAVPAAKTKRPPVDARVTIITPLMAGEVSGEIVTRLAARGPLGLDVPGFVRGTRGDTLVTAEWPEMADVLTQVTYLKLDDAEAEVLVGGDGLPPRRGGDVRVRASRGGAHARTRPSRSVGGRRLRRTVQTIHRAGTDRPGGYGLLDLRRRAAAE